MTFYLSTEISLVDIIESAMSSKHGKKQGQQQPEPEDGDVSGKDLNQAESAELDQPSMVALLSSMNRVPTFSGRADEDLNRFLIKADNFFRRLPIPAAQRGLYLGDWLKGEAETWYLTLSADQQGDYDQLRKALSRRFEGHNDRMAHKLELSKRLHGGAELVDTYADAFMRLANKVKGMSEEDKIEAFVRGIRAELRGAVLKAKHETLLDCINTARDTERVLNAEAIFSGTSRPALATASINVVEDASFTDRRESKLARQIDMLTGVIARLEQSVDQLGKKIDSAPTARKVDGFRQVSEKFMEQRAKIDSLGIPVCTRCQRIGHDAEGHDSAMSTLWNSRPYKNNRKNE